MEKRKKTLVLVGVLIVAFVVGILVPAMVKGVEKPLKNSKVVAILEKGKV